MRFQKVDSIEDMTDREYTKYMAEKNNADIAYVAMMSDIDMPIDETNNIEETGE